MSDKKKGKGKWSCTVKGITFHTKKSAEDYVRNLRDQYPNNVDLSGEHLEFMVDYLRHFHDDPEEKIGCGVARIWVQVTPPYTTRGFWLERVDGTKTDFSFRIHPRTPMSEFQKACRNAICGQVANFKQDYFFENAADDGHVNCQVSGERVSIDGEVSHVDHVVPFKEIVEGFISKFCIDIFKVELTGGDGVIGTSFVDPAMTQTWQEYHAKHATLRVVAKRVNLSTLRRTDATNRI